MKCFRGETLGAVLSRRLAHAGLLPLQDNPPYDKGAFRIEINFPAEYPFKPPKITFKTKIYHPNIDEKGQVCLPVISAENWKPATKTDQGKASAPGPPGPLTPGARSPERPAAPTPRPGGCCFPPHPPHPPPPGVTCLHSAPACGSGSHVGSGWEAEGRVRGRGWGGLVA